MRLWLIGFGILCALGSVGCASAPRVTLQEIPVFPTAAPFAPNEMASSESAKFVAEHAALGRSFKWKGVHSEARFWLSKDAKPQDAQSWYFDKLTALGWRSVYAAAYTVYTNGAGQYLTVYVLAGTAEDYELLLALDE
ncbi:MAG: hypothetical protein HDKAJFGB_03120 [Anaerolineae bacterium]|nr:hypothetical protein [Anaerolineae bacterium]